ncbi:DUF3179 domain-containing protein [Desulfovibrio mangrovi]|uniref:DUF3179 domain-containing protein n=1 Tax=Desulfovibrio mangrovi TaxID=2976983 RepID=UPI00224751C7|nr:DUF3179 domain-containing protein [Desulfovibrio mangrovi]UZP67848.1 DUF3179 domain-containing protein [Desulfovibrio mangrovi]
MLSLSPAASHAEAPDPAALRRMADQLVDTGVKPDQIPSLTKPAYLPVADAALSMDDEDQVFVARFPGAIRIYPQRIMVYHEVVNEEIDGVRVSITYSPLSGGLVGYHARAGRFDTSFGVSGSLLNANTVLFDRATGSLWPQLLGIAIEGPMLGTKLDRFPLIWTTWERAARAYPDAMVLSRATGFNRRYGSDPYGSYSSRDSYYNTQQITYPVLNRDNRLPPKERIAALEQDGLYYALPHSVVRREGAVNFSLGVTPMVAVWDRKLATVRVYERIAAERTVDFFIQNDKLLDKATHSEWSYDGEALFGVLRGAVLPPVASMDCMWFAWVGFFPNAEIIPRQ